MFKRKAEITVYLKDKEGVMCYEDKDGNIYDMEDIISEKTEVRKIKRKRFIVKESKVSTDQEPTELNCV
tara:strand:- start:280 stop:486 length:207 start_codon:yes stop_codon:yes gene_type:complete